MRKHGCMTIQLLNTFTSYNKTEKIPSRSRMGLKKRTWMNWTPVQDAYISYITNGFITIMIQSLIHLLRHLSFWFYKWVNSNCHQFHLWFSFGILLVPFTRTRQEGWRNMFRSYVASLYVWTSIYYSVDMAEWYNRYIAKI